MMTVIDETSTNAGFEMEEIEFMECLARLSELASLPPICVDEEESAEWSYQKRFALPLHVKMEAFVKRLIQNEIPKWMRDQY